MHPLKAVLNPFIRTMSSNKLTWTPFSALVRIGNWLDFKKLQHDGDIAEEKLKRLYADGKVKGGFFEGLRYASMKSVYSSLYPKLFGSYEIELYPVLQEFNKNDYRNILDIGCAEGYYAVGLAMKFPHAKVYAYDIEPEALRLCSELAIHNNVQDRVILGEKCSSDTLEKFGFSGRSLIVSDCEGYERELFTKDNIGKLGSVDLIIELHSFVYRDVKEYLVELFAPSHDHELISSFDTARKLFDFKPFMENMTKAEQMKVIDEKRPFTMEWLILKPKKSNG